MFIFPLLLAITPIEEFTAKRIHNHLLIHDARSASTEAKIATLQYPQSQLIWQAYIKAEACAGNEREMMKGWNQYVAMFPVEQKNRELMETLAWGVIDRGSSSSSPLIRMVSLLGGFFAQDAKSVSLVYNHLSDNNAHVRSLAVRLASQLRDEKLHEKIIPLAANEKVWSIRMQAIKALGAMHIRSQEPFLFATLSNPSTSAEEMKGCVESLVLMLDEIKPQALANLTKSDRAGLRLLACEVIVKLDLNEQITLVMPLLKDSHSGVRAAALQALGLLQIRTYNGQSIEDLITPLLTDTDPTVAITAAWLLTLNNRQKGQEAFKRWLNHPQENIRLIAIAALCACGNNNMPLLKETFFQGKDPYVRLNAAINLLKQREEVFLAAETIRKELKDNHTKWMWKEIEIYKALAPSTLTHQDEADSQYPETTDQMVRLELLNILAIVNDSKAQDAVKQFLQQNSWGVAGMAATLLLTEGDDQALELVRQLLDDPQKKIQVQAALILALWGRDEQAIMTLEKAYATADRDLKERILEGIGRIGAESSIPFLVEKLQEPSQFLRILAASALLQCLYH